MNTKIVLKVENLTVKFGKKVVLENVSFAVNEGEIIAIVGPNGSGKTTLLKTILGFVKPYIGKIELLNKSPKKAIKTGKVGYLPQKSSIPKDFPFSALDIVLLGLVNKKISRKEKEELALKYLDFVGMLKYKDYPFTNLSGGQQQRVSIARVLVSKPKIIFLDEPSTGIDVVAQESFYEFLTKLKKEENLTVVMVSHDIGVIGKYVDKIAGLNRHLHFYGKPDDIFKKNVLSNIYGCDIQLIVHSPECISCEHFHYDVKKA